VNIRHWLLGLPAICLLLALWAGVVSADTTYVVQPGDTLSHLARRFSTTVQALVAANQIADPDLIYVGQVLTIPDNGVSTTYVVQPGDTLSELAVRSSVPMDVIAQTNEIANVDLIYSGQKLTIPGGYISPPGPTHTPLPTPTPTARPTPAPTPLPTATPTLNLITTGNADRMREVGRMGLGTIQRGALSPDGQTLALAGSLGVWLYDFASLTLLDFFPGAEGNYRGVAWSPDGDRLALGITGRGSGAEIWDVAQGERLLTLEAEGSVRQVAWSPDGTRVAGVGTVIEAYVWDAATAEPLQFMMEKQLLPYSVAWSPDGTQLATGGFGSALRIWDPDSGEIVDEFDAEVAVLDVAWSHDGEAIAAATADGVRVWDAVSGQEQAALELEEDNFSWSVAWSPDNTQIAVGSLGEGYVWDLLGDEARLAAQGADFLYLLWSPDGEELAAIGWDGTVRVVDPSDGEELRALAEHSARFMDLALSPDETQLLLAGMDGHVHLWRRADGRHLRFPSAHANMVQSVAWSPDGRMFASGGADGTVRLWLLPEESTAARDAASREAVHVMSGIEGDISGLDWSPDGSMLASTSGEGIVNVWDTATGDELQALGGYEELVTDVAWSPDGAFLAATGDFDPPTLRVWRTADWGELYALEGHKSLVGHLAWSPDGALIASGDADGLLIVWDATSGQKLRDWQVPVESWEGTIRSLAFSPDGSMLAAATVGGRIYVWESQSGRELVRLSGHEDGATGLAWSADGLLLLSGSMDGTVRLWSVANGP
jgi:WD40 repeat protein/LysM repeat protein